MRAAPAFVVGSLHSVPVNNKITDLEADCLEPSLSSLVSFIAGKVWGIPKNPLHSCHFWEDPPTVYTNFQICSGLRHYFGCFHRPKPLQEKGLCPHPSAAIGRAMLAVDWWLRLFSRNLSKGLLLDMSRIK